MTSTALPPAVSRSPSARIPAALKGDVAVRKAEKARNHRVDRPAVETVFQGEAPDARGAILLPGKGPDRQRINLRQVNGRTGTARDDAGQAAVVHVKMGDPDPPAILHPPPDFRERGLQRRQDPVQVGTRVDQRETTLFRK